MGTEPGALSRRAVLGLAAGGAAFLAGCGTDRRGSAPGRATTGTPPSRAPNNGPTTTEALDPAAWAGLAGTLTGHLVRPDDPSYPTAVALYDSRFDGLRPQGIAFCADATDVQRCVGFARAHGLALSVRSGGHSYGGYSSGPGLIVDVTAMHAVATGAATATIGAGARLIDVYSTLNAAGVSIPGGSCPTVGIAGLTLGGGAGVVDRRYGLACDRIVQVQLVTADARLVTADAGTNDGLFWACRGGGGGNFGVATSFQFATFPTTGVTVFTVTWPWAAADQLLPAYLSWAPTAPDALWANCLLQTDPARAAPTAQVGGVWLGTPVTLAPVLDQLVTAVGATPASRFSQATSFAHAMYVEAGCAGLSQAACHLPTQAAGGQLTRQPSLAKSDYLNQPLTDAGVAAVVAGIDQRRQEGGMGAVGYDSYGGAVNRVAAADTAFVHRDAIASAQYNVSFTPGTSVASLAQAQTWLDGWYATLRPYVSGYAYQNYIDPRLADWAHAYYGTNLARLRAVKRMWDPDDVWHFAQSIPPA